jgi:PhnB protein
MAQPVPQPTHTVVPYLQVQGAARAIEFYTKALGAREQFRMTAPDGRLMHAELRIGDGAVYLADAFPEFGSPGAAPAGVVIHLNVPDCDELWARAMAARATPTMPLADMFWGDRYGKFRDPFGHEWSVSTTIEQLSPEEMKQRAAAAMAQMGKGQP